MCIGLLYSCSVDDGPHSQGHRHPAPPLLADITSQQSHLGIETRVFYEEQECVHSGTAVL